MRAAFPTNRKYLCIATDVGLDTLCAHQIYTDFLAVVANIVSDIGGSTHRRLAESTGYASDEDVPSWMHCRLTNSNIASLAAIYFESGIGTIEEAYFAIIPAFRHVGILPSLGDAARAASREARSFLRDEDWASALKIDIWGCKTIGNIGYTPVDKSAIFFDADCRLKLLKTFCHWGDGMTEVRRFLKMMETILSLRAELLEGHSPTLASSLVWLYTFARQREANTPGLASLVVKCLTRSDFSQGNTVDTVLRFIHTLNDIGKDTLAATLAVLVWNATQLSRYPSAVADSGISMKYLIKRNFEATMVLVRMRMKKGHFSTAHSLAELRDFDGELSKVNPITRMSLKLEDLESSSASVDLKLTSAYRTPLQLAAQFDRLEMVNSLLSRGADVNAAPKRYNGCTALQAASGSGCIPVMKVLLAHGARVNGGISSLGGSTALRMASARGHRDAVKLLLQHNAVDHVDPPNYYLEHCGARNSMDEIRSIQSFGPALHKLNQSFVPFPALTAAARGGHLEIVQDLLSAEHYINLPVDEYYGISPLQGAAASGNISVVELLLTKQHIADTGPAQVSGCTALQMAAQSGHIEIVELLLRMGVKIEQDKPAIYYGRTALQAAAERGSQDIINLLISYGASPDEPASQYYGSTALQAAAQSGDVELVKMLLRAKADPNLTPQPFGGLTALQAAASSGKIEILKVLLEAGADVNEPASEQLGRTALQAAAESGHIGITTFLLRAGAEVNAKPSKNQGRTALQAAAENGHIDIVELLIQENAEVDAAGSNSHGVNALEAAAANGHTQIVELMVLGKANSNRKGGAGALHAAARKGYVEIVEILIRNCLRLDLVRPNGAKAALQAAARTGNIEIVEMLIGMGTDVNSAPYDSSPKLTPIRPAVIIDDFSLPASQMQHYAGIEFERRTALQAAAGGGHIMIVERLIREGARINEPLCVETGGRTELQAAAENDHIDIVEYLIENGSEVNTAPCGVDGFTALQAAARNGHLDIVKLLIQENAEVDGPPCEFTGGTALQLAAENGHTDVVNILIKNGAEINSRTNGRGGSALIRAIRNGHPEAVKSLLGERADIKAGGELLTALQLAAIHGNAAIIHDLVEAGADFGEVGSKTSHPDSEASPIDIAKKYGHHEIFAKWLPPAPEQAYPVRSAVCQGLDLAGIYDAMARRK